MPDVLGRALRAEWAKLVTHPPTLIVLVAALLAPPVLSVAMGVSVAGHAAAAGVDPATQGFEVAGFGQPLVVVFAALVVGGEFQGGLLRSSLLALPRRLSLLGAKLLLIILVTAPLAALSVGAAVVLRQLVLGERGLTPDRFTPAMYANLATVAINWMLIALIAAAVTALARSVVPTIVVLVPLVLGLGVALVSVLPWLRFAPDLAGLQLLARYPGLGLLDPLPGGLVMAAWAAVLCGTALAVFARRDA